ncbi:MAG: hypothetical protein GWP14_04625 [Actinobacteria bacterium]|nr:hypothetical protein [Actinomycetota bacterium]
MPDMMETGMAWLEDQRHQHRTKAVTYHRGSESVEVQATIGKWTFEVDDGMGILERIESRDFLILTVDLVLAGQATEPQRGDRIKETSGNKVYVYEVLAPGKEDCWRFSDPYRKTLRIHSKHVDTEDVV